MSKDVTYEWRKLKDSQVGDFIHMWGENLEVTKVGRSFLGAVILTYKNNDGKKTTLRGVPDLSYFAVRREQLKRSNKQ